jgi:Ca-activated chloride channel family protein
MDMVRGLIAAAGALALVGGYPMIPHAGADGEKFFTALDGQVRCMLSPDYLPFGGGPMVVCQRLGANFGSAPWSTEKYPRLLNLAVDRGPGQSFWAAGTLPAGNDDAVVGPGQTYRANGWTVTNNGLRIVIMNDVSGHGIKVDPVDVRTAPTQ